MYYEGTIADRLREAQREINAVYARHTYLSEQLSQAYEQIRELKEENQRLKSGTIETQDQGETKKKSKNNT